LKLYEINSVMRALMDTLSDLPLNADGKPLDAAAQAEHDAALAAFESTSNDLRTKLRAYVGYALELRVQREAREAAMDAIAKNVLQKMAAANERDLKKEAWLLGAVQGTMQSMAMAPIKCDEFTIALQKLPKTVVISNEDALPSEYLRTIPAVAESTAPDKKKILADLKEGVVIAGAELSQDAYKLAVK